MATGSARAACAALVAAAHDGRLDPICITYGVRLMSAFGSATRPGSGEPGDLDVAVGFVGRQGPRQPRDRLELWSALVELTGYESIDLVVIDVDDPVLRAEALTGVALYENEFGEYAESQIAALGECRDTAPMRRRSLELLAS